EERALALPALEGAGDLQVLPGGLVQDEVALRVEDGDAVDVGGGAAGLGLGEVGERRAGGAGRRGQRAEPEAVEAGDAELAAEALLRPSGIEDGGIGVSVDEGAAAGLPHRLLEATARRQDHLARGRAAELVEQ